MLDKKKTVTPRKSVRGPGRPVIGRDEQNDARNKILDIAEKLFGEHGWNATSLRDIAAEAEVNPAMITYYFGTKKNLLEVVFKRRGTEIAANWVKGIDALEARPGPGPSVYELLRTYLSVGFHTKKEGPSGEAFVKLQARVHNETDEFFFRLRREVYDAATQRYIAALERALPEVDPADINWRMIFVIGSYLYMLAGVDRLNDLSGGRFVAIDIDEATDRATKFMAGGMCTESTYNKSTVERGKNKEQKTRARARVKKPST